MPTEQTLYIMTLFASDLDLLKMSIKNVIINVINIPVCRCKDALLYGHFCTSEHWKEGSICCMVLLYIAKVIVIMLMMMISSNDDVT